ncbi:MAG: NAD(P)/FAD-dependent oxidoreductase [Vulcanimicrobiota bacterium]
MVSVVVIGAGPAGLTAAYELLENKVTSTILEADPEKVGGISRTAEYRGYRFDIGGHRFFSKNKDIENLWSEWLEDEMISVPRMSRILYNGKFFDYPLKAMNAFLNLGPVETVRCVLSYLWSQLAPRKSERSFEDWVVNRFGHRLFSIFFKTYTEKVWGMPCHEISADWAAQRIKNLNLWKAAINALGLGRRDQSIKTLIDEFRYPRLGPGMMWERLSENLLQGGCTLRMGHPVTHISREQGRAIAVEANGARFEADHFISTMPLRNLIEGLEPAAPAHILDAARGLKYRDYLTVVLVLAVDELFPDNWIYIHDPSVKVGRIQNYKNWSRAMVPEDGYTCLGLEYFCDVGDDLWELSESELIELGLREIVQLGLAVPDQMRDGTVVRMPKAYPVYDDEYQQRVDLLREFLETEVPNVHPVGRNGMHRYNNQDHAMLTGILAARNILGQGPFDPWLVNADAEYLEEDDSPKDSRLVPRRLTDSDSVSPPG